MTAPLTGKVALVTGGGTGIGKAIALAFAREGATVVVAGRRPEPLADTVAEIESTGGASSAVQADLTNSADAERLMATVVERHGGLHVAVNNAGALGAFGPLADVDEASWEFMLAGNLTATWLSMKHEIAHMRAHGGGSIVNISSNIGAHKRLPGLGVYAATKAAVSVLTRTAALENIEHGIRVNAVSPGPADTPMSLLPGETPADRADRMKDALPIGRVATTEEVAAAVLWLAGPESSFAVGHDLVLDGGITA